MKILKKTLDKSVFLWYNIFKIKKEGLSMKKTNIIWEILGYATLILCVIGQITVGWLYIVAQCAYLLANMISVIRDIALKLPTSNLVKDIVFTGITIALIIVKCF